MHSNIYTMDIEKKVALAKFGFVPTLNIFVRFLQPPVNKLNHFPIICSLNWMLSVCF